MSYHRFIGGPHDGEWHGVTRDAGLFLPRYWTIRERPRLSISNFDPNKPIEPTKIRETTYVPLPLHVGKHEAVTFFIEKSMTPEGALLRLAECYRPSEGKSESQE